MAIIQRISVFVSLSIILSNGFVSSANVNVLEKRIDQSDSYIDALHKTHADDSLNCECKLVIICSIWESFFVQFLIL